jgi:hypothetical protein
MKVSRLRAMLANVPDESEVRIAGGGNSDYEVLSVYQVPGIFWVDIVLPDHEAAE